MRDFLIRIKLRRDLLVVGSKVISTTLLSFVLLNSTFGQTGVGGGLSSGRLLDQGLHEVGINLYCDDLEAETRSWRRSDWLRDRKAARIASGHATAVQIWDFTIDGFGKSHPDYPDGCVIADQEVRELLNYPTIRDIELGATVSKKALEVVVSLPELRSVSFFFHRPVTAEDLRILKNAPHLRTLRVRANNGLEPNVAPLPGLGNLKNIEYLELDYRFNDSQVHTDALCHEIAQLSLLKQLRVDLGKMNYPPDFDALKDLGELEAVSTRIYEPKITFRELAKLRHLKKLKLQPFGQINAQFGANPRVTSMMNHNFSDVAKLTSLESLTLDFILFPRNGDLSFLGELSNCPTLRRLDLENCEWMTKMELTGVKSKSLEEVYIDNCVRLSNQGLFNLANGTNLKTLTLMNCMEISDEGVRALEKMTNLGRLEIEYEGGPKPDGLTAEGLRALKEKLPKCFISLRQYSKETGMSVDVVSLK
jgi:hypothetical protein